MLLLCSWLLLGAALCNAQAPAAPVVPSQNSSSSSSTAFVSSSTSQISSTTATSTLQPQSIPTVVTRLVQQPQAASQAPSLPPVSTNAPMEALPSLKIRTLENTELSAADNVKMVMMIASNGNKNPESFIPNSPLKDVAQAGFLSALGKNQAFNLGTFMKQRYGQLWGNQFNDTEMQMLTSSVPSVQMTMAIMASSMFAPSDKDKESQWSSSLKWNPVPMQMDDQLLATHEQKCPAMEEISKANEKAIEKALGDKKQIADFIASRLGWTASSDKWAQIGYNIEQYALRSLPLPDWMNTNPFNNTSLYSTTLGFRFLRQLACAKNSECRHIWSGSLLWKMASILKARRDGSSQSKLVMMTTSSDVLASLLWSMNIETAGVPSGRSMILEYRDAPEAQVRALFTEFIDQKPEALAVSIIRMPGCTSDNEWCPISKIMQAIGPETVSDWKRICRFEDAPKCETKGDGVPLKDAVGGFNKISLSIDCTGEEDRSGTFYCQQWAKYEYCKEYISVRDYYCRYTCLCDDKFRVKQLTTAAVSAKSSKTKAKH